MKMELQLIDLPQVCLEEIFNKLSFAEISRLGATCKYFREIAKTIFRLHLKNLEETIEAEMEKIETEANKPQTLSISEHLHLALLHSVLRILLSEAKMLKAHCWRYMKDPTYDFCFPAGIILDEFDRILKSVRNKSLKKEMEPEITTTLFHLGETFYDYFDSTIETYFRESSGLEVKITSESNRQTFLPSIHNFVSSFTRERILKDVHRYMTRRREIGVEETLQSDQIANEIGMMAKEKVPDIDTFGKNERTVFGVKILDILNCCASSNFHTIILHNYKNDGFKLKSHYELRDINVLEALPTIGLSVSTHERQLNKICRYIRNNVRWTNLFHPLQDLWMLEDAIEINKNVDTASALLRQWKLQKTPSSLKLDNPGNNVFQYDCRKVISRFKNRFGLLVTASLECPTVNNLPLKVHKCLKTKLTNYDDFLNVKDPNAEYNIPSDNFGFKETIQNIDMGKWNDDILTYKFHLELKIQYPSFLSETVREAILKVDQIGEKTTVTSQGDDMRKSATYRAEECFD